MLSPRRETGHGWFTHCKKHEELAFSWNWYAGDLAPTHARLILEQTEDGTLIRIFHHGWGYGPEWDHELNDCKNGWNVCLTSLAKLVKGA
jgi:hypothetical protein